MKKTMAFLQNAWFKPGTLPRHIEMYNTDQNFHRRVLAMCATGKALIKAFGAELYGQIVWDNASLEHGSVRDHVSEPDFMHMARRIAQERPDVLILFGGKARLGWERVCDMADLNGLKSRKIVLYAPHPMARGSQKASLEKIAAEVKRLCSN